jgi:hypothetical protein
MLFILIPGLILVALMVWASTRIKRTAAAAFEAETVETDDFTLDKPEGFLNKINRDPSLAFEAYSRDMGTGDASEFRMARVEIHIYEQRRLDYAAGAIRESTTVTSEITEVIGERKYHIIEAETVEKGVGFRELYKLAEKDGRVFELRIVVLGETNDEFSRKIDTILNSFVLK